MLCIWTCPKGGSLWQVDLLWGIQRERQALEKTYNKPKKRNSGIVGISRRKDSVCRRNIRKHEKVQFKNVLQEWCCLNEYHEYVLRHDYSIRTTVADKKFVNGVIQYVTKHGNPFDRENSNELSNIVTNSQIDFESSTFLCQCLKLGKDAYPNFF